MTTKSQPTGISTRGTQPSWTRRSLLGALGSGVLASSVGTLATTSRRPSLPKCAGSRASPHQRIDAHLHVFNGTDLQIAGFLKRSVAPEYPTVAPLLKLIADPLQTFVWAFSPTAEGELKRLNGLTNPKAEGKGFLPENTASALALDNAETDAQYAQFLLEQFQREDVRAALGDILLRGRRDAPALLPRLKQAPRTPTEARALAGDADRAGGIPIFDYLSRYFSYRYANFFAAIEQFTCRDLPPIDTFVALMVDFDEPLAPGTETKSRISQQTTVVSKICELSRGRLVALAPYCPFKDLARHGASLKNVTEAWTKPGFVGAKIYPPMEFKPFDNGQPLDGALASFYHECIRHDAVVAAHAGPSLCIDSGPCDAPGPPGWQKALDYVLKAEKAPLRVNLGHYGGVLGDDARSTKWPEGFLALMAKPSGERLYADLGYSSQVLKSSNDKYAIQRLSDLLTSSGSALPSRLLYGSDWLMLGLESRWRNYTQRMQTVIQGVEQKTGMNGLGLRLFGGNARRWLGLESTGSLASRNTVSL